MTVLAESEQAFVEGSDSPGLTGAPSDLAALPLERVESEICTLAGQIAAATCRFLRLLAEFDAREGWAGWQVRSCAHWLSWRCGLDLRTAREHVRVARALAKLPSVTEAFGQGRLSYSKVRALTRVATPETETDLLEAALSAPAAQLERLVRGLETAPDDSVESKRKRRRGVKWRWDEDGSLVIWGRLDPADGARLLAGLTRMEHERTTTAEPVSGTGSAPESAAGQPESTAGQPESTAGRDGSAEPSGKPSVTGGTPSDLGPALVAAAELACTNVEAPVHAPGAEVVVHVDLDTFVETARQVEIPDADTDSPVTPDESQPQPEPGTAPLGRGRQSAARMGKGRPTPRRPGKRTRRLDDGPDLRTAMLQMLACDGRIQLSVDGPDGRTLDLGRRRRRPTNRQVLALWRRDRGCAVPGCGQTRFLHAHHARPWASGGRTSLDNLVLLCGEHHRLLHRGAFSIVALGRQRFRFRGTGESACQPAPGISGDARGLAAAHADITPTTIEPDWDGSDLNLHDAVTAYLSRWANQNVA